MLPKTMLCTFTAVPGKPWMPLMRRYEIALSAFQLLKTASIASSSCRIGSCGKSAPTCLRYTALYFSQSSMIPSVGTSVSSFAPCFIFTSAKASSK